MHNNDLLHHVGNVKQGAYKVNTRRASFYKIYFFNQWLNAEGELYTLYYCTLTTYVQQEPTNTCSSTQLD